METIDENRQELILVDELDDEIGTADRLRCHSGEGMLHRAFTIFVFNEKGDVLIQRRGEGKSLWPLFWESSCSGHPLKGESVVPASRQRLEEELGIRTELEPLGKFQYQESYEDVGSENEICFVLSGEYDGKVQPDPEEVLEFKWIEMEKLREDIKKNKGEYAPWLVMGLEMVVERR